MRSFAVQGTRALEGNVTEVVLSDDSATLARRAGQFAFATFENGPSREDHPFTISSAPGLGVRFSIRASGDFTRKLAQHPPSGTVRVEGPYGGFDSARGRTRQLWLAAGIGITPFLSMAGALDPSREVELVWSVRDLPEAVYAEELEAAALARPKLPVAIHPTSELGHVDIASLETIRLGRDCSVFICGPLPMRVQALRELARLGIPRQEVYFEEFRLR